tara:strand:+ start:205 stop:510 length:306 start_codon:yes stop_codon:yes gene_type:complete
MKIEMTREAIKEMLVEAYEAGWRGCLELKEEYAEQVLPEEVVETEDEQEYRLPPEIVAGSTITVNATSVLGSALGGEYTFELQGVEPETESLLEETGVEFV